MAVQIINIPNPKKQSDYLKVYLPKDILQFCREHFICVRFDNTVHKKYSDQFQKLIDMFLVACSSNFVSSFEYSEGFVYSFRGKSHRVFDYLFKKDSNQDVHFFKRHLDDWIKYIDLAVIRL